MKKRKEYKPNRYEEAIFKLAMVIDTIPGNNYKAKELILDALGLELLKPKDIK